MQISMSLLVNEKIHDKFVLQDKWIGLLHHVCNNHECLDGKCGHKELDMTEHVLNWFDCRENVFKTRQEFLTTNF